MRISRLYLEADLAIGRPVTLNADQQRYLTKVLRLNHGADVSVFNGHGGCYRATLLHEGESWQLMPQAFSAADLASPLAVTLLQAVGRGERMDYAVQKAVELGVSAIRPVFSERTVVKLDAKRLQKRRDHWRAVMISACEQCGQNRLPQLLEPLSLAQALQQEEALCRLVLAPAAEGGGLPSEKQTSMALLVGPEGGLSAAEIQLAQQLGWRPWQLGPRVLRTETAGVAALAVLQQRWGDW